MNIVIVDIPNTYEVFLSRKWITTIEGTLQMDLSLASIPNANQEILMLYITPFMRHFVEEP